MDILNLNKTPYENGKLSGEYFKKYINIKTPKISNKMIKQFDNLKKEYNDESITFDDISVPGMERYNLDDGIFKDPSKNKIIFDYYECQHSLVTKIIIEFAKAIKEESNNSFYQYH